jgi:hypothetical protein
MFAAYFSEIFIEDETGETLAGGSPVPVAMSITTSEIVPLRTSRNGRGLLWHHPL